MDEKFKLTTSSPIDFINLKNKLTASDAHSQKLKAILKESQLQLLCEDNQNTSICQKLQWYSDLIDYMLKFLWQHYLGTEKTLCLIAVGGYGRAELFPYSDIDILILHQTEFSMLLTHKINNFLKTIWDMGLIVGHSVRLENDCLQQSRNDLSIYTNLLEMRIIIGDQSFFENFLQKFQIEYHWKNSTFYKAKENELMTRQLKYSETAYLLEPDLKYSPGTLRDLHHLKWLCLQHFQTIDLHCLTTKNILDSADFQILVNAEKVLGEIRYALHQINNKDDNRLFFDKQLQLADWFGYQNTENKKAVEDFMRFYFIQIKEVRALHEIITHYFYEISLLNNKTPINLDNTYELIGNLISIKKHIKISENPELLLQTFLQLGHHSTATGFTAGTLVQLRKHLYLINDAFRKNPMHQKLFINIFKTRCVFTILKEMHHHKILEHYLTEFEPIVGQTQYGLFHLYTVDQHILFVIKKIEYLKTENSLYQKIFETLEQPELLYLAALFHDIGKGRNTDHSNYGSNAALEFAKQHNLPEKQGELIAWLVKKHLFMSQVAQKQDINDKKIIAAFAKTIKNIKQLNYLYLLTVADIQATNENLWNSWKDSLLKQLYYATHSCISSLPSKNDKLQQVKLKKQTVLAQFQPTTLEKINALWAQIGDDYFYKEQLQHIYWHTCELLHANFSDKLVLVSTQNHQEHGATEIFIYCKDRDDLFANTVLLLDRLQLNVVDAKIITDQNGFCLDTFSVLNREHKTITELSILKNIELTLSTELSKKRPNPRVMKRHLSRQLTHFTNHIELKFRTSGHPPLTKLMIQSTDKPGFLAAIGSAFRELHIRVQNAKISTIGTEIEDVFYICDQQNKPLKNRAKQIELAQCIKHYLYK